MASFDVAFFWTGKDTALPECLVRSARNFFGDIAIHQLTDRDTPSVAGVSHCRRYELSKYPMLSRVAAWDQLQIERPTLFLDADMVVIDKFTLPDISENEVLTVGRPTNFRINHLYPEPYPEFSGKMIEDMMPFLGCFLFTRSRKFLTNLHTRYRTKPERLLRWYGDQVVMKEELDAGEFHSVPVPPLEYAYPVKRFYTRNEIKDMQKRDGTKIIHAKGCINKLTVLEKTCAELCEVIA